MEILKIPHKRRRAAWLEVMGDLQCIYCPHDATEHDGLWDGLVGFWNLLMSPMHTRLIALTCRECGGTCWRRADVEIVEE